MKFLRSITAAILVVAFMQYGVAATAAPHAHASDDFHVVHAIALDTHDRSDHLDGPEQAPGAAAGELSGTSQDQTDLHAHCAPHFNEADAPVLLTAAIVSDATRFSAISILLALRRAAPPFKPPRAVL